MFVRALILMLMMAVCCPVGGAVAVAQDEPEKELLQEGKLMLTFSPFMVSVLNRGRLRGTANLLIGLQLRDNGEFEKLDAMRPQLRSDISIALSSLSARRWSVNYPIDPDIVSRYLKPVVDNRVGAGRLDVYVLKALIEPS